MPPGSPGSGHSRISTGTSRPEEGATRGRTRRPAAASRLAGCVGALCVLLGPAALAQDSRTVIGPSNPSLQEGATALLAGDAEEGVRLTLLGLSQAPTARERQTGWSNLCAGYVMLGRLETALEYCDRVIAETDRNWRAYSNRALVYVKMRRYEEADADLTKAEALAPSARTVRAVRTMWRDAVEPVAPAIVIDDRRQPPGDDED